MSSAVKRYLAAALCLVMALGLFLPAGAAPAVTDEDVDVVEAPVEEAVIDEAVIDEAVMDEDGVGTMPTPDRSDAAVNEPCDDESAALASAADPYSHNFTTDGSTSTFYTISGSVVDLSSAGITLTGDYAQYTKGIELGDDTITFTAPDDGTVTVVLAHPSEAKGFKFITTPADGGKVTTEKPAMSANPCTYTHDVVKGNTYTLSKNNTKIHALAIQFKGQHIHQWSDWTQTKAPSCTVAGEEQRTCSADDCPAPTETRAVDKIAHTSTNVAAVAATCVKDGTAAGTKCSVCGEVLSGCTVIKATGQHDYGADGACKNCGVTEHTQHIWDSGEVTVAATCTKAGTQVLHCTVAKCEETKTETIPALGHDLEHHAAVEPVCGAGGHPAYDTCKRCDYTTFKAAAHTDANGDGVCDVCQSEIAKLLTGAGGWFETLYVETSQFEPTAVTAVSWTGASNGKLDADGLTYLVRAGLNGGKTRIDIPGLKAGRYTVTVTAGGVSYQAANVEVMAYDRSGFAHYNYTKGVGAYRDDGVLKDDAVILYVNDQNKDTVTVTSADGTTVTGIGHILNSVGQDTGGGQTSKGGLANNNKGILKKLADDKTPLVVRIIDDVSKPDGLTAFNSADYGGTKGDNGAMARMSAAANVTIEGIGPNASMNGWGLHFIRNSSDVGTDRGTSVEIRNLAFRNVPEDCIGMEGQQSGGTLTAPVERCWVHNCSFFVPNILNPAESDKQQGDGACDFKRGQYMTMSYCHFDGYHKTNLVGSSDSSLQYHITWHHNYWQNCESRGPLGRQANMHIYNNIYENQTSYAMNPRANCYIFSEYNVFDRVKNPMQIKAGAIKSYHDVFSGTSGAEDGTIVTDKSKKVDCANKYANFDTDPAGYIAKGDYKLDTITGARQNILAYAGPMKAQIISAEDIPTEVVVQDRVPQNAVVLPYDQALNKPYIASSAEKDNIRFDLSGADASFLKIGKTKIGQDIIFKVSEPVDISIEDGGGTGKAALYNASGENLVIGTGTAENLPAGVYFIQSSMVDPSKGEFKEAKIAHLTITKAASPTPPHVHSFTNYVQTVAPTCTKEGTKLATCACGDATDRQAIPMIPHDFATGVCPVCGALASVLGEVDPNAPTVDVESVDLAVEGPITIKQGDTQALAATILPANATDKSLEWSSSDASVVTVSRKGLLSAVGPGAATVTATAANGKSDSVEVVVLGVSLRTYTFDPKKEGPAEIKTSNGEIEVTDWSNTYFTQSGTTKWKAPGYNASKKDYTTGAFLLGTGETGSLDFTVTAPATLRTLTLSVSSTSSKNTSAVALKNSAGEYILSDADKTINAVSGTAAFTVTFSNLPAGTYSVVAPKNVAFSDVEPDSEETSFATDASDPNKRGVWIRSASVTTAQVVDGEYVEVSGLTLSDTAVSTLTVGRVYTLEATVTPANASNSVVSWSTSDASVATVDQTGTVTARKAGTVTITAKAGSKTASCVFTIAAADDSERVPVSAVAVTDAQGKTSGAVTADDATLQLTADVTPDEATDPSVTWSVDPANQGVAVNSLGKVTVVHTAVAGVYTVTATAKDGSGVKGSYTLTVSADPTALVDVTGVTLDRATGSVTVGKTLKLTATVQPANATNKQVTWASDDESVATVDQTGTVTAKAVGTATVTVTTDDGDFTATCAVTVTAAAGGNSSPSGSGGGSSRPSGSGSTAPAPTHVLPFVDVPINAWYLESVQKVYDLGLMRGTDSAHFAPHDTTTRAMVATVLYRLDGEKKANVADLFGDVTTGSWYEEAVKWAADKGVVKGYSEDVFAPDDNVTREQLVVMLYRYAAPTVLDKSDALGQFADAASISDWAAEAMQWAVKAGVINGKGDGTLDPQGLATRAEICAMLVRFVNIGK